MLHSLRDFLREIKEDFVYFLRFEYWGTVMRHRFALVKLPS
jgi:hypothetical protein